MQTKDAIRIGIQNSYDITRPLIEEMKEAPVVFPTANGGNHALWLVGHMAHSTGSLLWEVMRGETNPVAEWAEHFGHGTQPHDDAAKYPPYDTVAAKFHEMHTEALNLLDQLDERDLDQPSKQIPEGAETLFGTYRDCFMAHIIHISHHRGQLAVARRAAKLQLTPD